MPVTRAPFVASHQTSGPEPQPATKTFLFFTGEISFASLSQGPYGPQSKSFRKKRGSIRFCHESETLSQLLAIFGFCFIVFKSFMFPVCSRNFSAGKVFDAQIAIPSDFWGQWRYRELNSGLLNVHPVRHFRGPSENRTRVSTMRMWCRTTRP